MSKSPVIAASLILWLGASLLGEAATQTDWAVGKWHGKALSVSPDSPLVSVEVGLIVERQADGRVRCMLVDMRNPSAAEWAPKCTVGSSRLELETARKNTLTVALSGQKLMGKFRTISPIDSVINFELSKQDREGA